MDYITITAENLEQEHVCCAISKNDDCQVAAKKGWLADRIGDGLVFRKGNVRGKLFIEYLPAEKAWIPIDAPGYMYIDCLWVAGQFKEHGYGSELLASCIEDSRAKGMAGLCALSSRKKKRPFLSDPGFLTHKGFREADFAEPFFSLLYLPFDDSCAIPRFRDCVGRGNKTRGYTLYYADQCPYTAKYVPLLREAAMSAGVPMDVIHIDSAAAAQSAPTPYTSFSLFRDGEFLTNEIPSVEKFRKLIGV